MQRIFYLLLIFFLISSCNRNEQNSDAYGNFEATEIIVSSQATGELIQLNFEEGDVLEPGIAIGLIDTTDLVLNKKLLIQQKQTVGAQLKSINSEIEVQKQQLKNNLINQKRVQNLYNQGAATQKQLDDINGMIDVIRKQISAIRSKKDAIINQMKSIDVQVEQIDERISKCIIRNPQRGTVLVKYGQQGELAIIGKQLYKLADLENMKLKAYISGDQLAQITIGQKVEVIYDDNKKEN